MVSDQRYLEDIKVLTQPAMEGRGDGTKGLEKAAQFLADNYKKFGLKPAGTSGYFQPFTVTTGARLQAKNRLEVTVNGTTKSLKLNENYVPLNFSAVGSISGPMVFVGYGASSDEFQYDDYANQDVKDKIVVMLRYEPGSFAQKSGNQGMTQHSHLITKAINARNHGAKAVILLNGKLGGGEEDLLMRFGSQPGPQDAGILLVQVKNAVAESWFQAAGKTLADVQQQIDSDGKPHSFAYPNNVQAALTVDIEKTHAKVNNVLAYLPGKTDEYVVIGAHYDHLGYGNADSLAPSQIGQIHPGADDNASGTAGVIELARYFSQRKEKLERGILFASFAGEELGLLGSAEWAKEPTLPLDKDVAMLNMDMIGRLKDDKLFIGGVGTGSNFDTIVKKDAAKYPFQIQYSAGGYAASDHTSFVTKKVPVLFFFSGLHSDYHKPSDTWDKINPHGAAELLAMISDIATELASEPARPQFVKVDTPPPASGGSERGYGPYFGSIPDFGETEKGVKFADVRPNSPAAKAGLQAGDVLIQFADKPINNLYDFTDALRRSKVGDVVEVKVMRDGKPLTAQVKLEQRR
ncbi:MAG TPA: M28 family peptidase [Terriglobales bacterium]|nr:M28 family peptidase [Terriglobales bacterium]